MQRRLGGGLSPLTCAFNDLHDAPGSGGQHGGLIQAQAAHVKHMEAVHVLAGRHRVADSAFVDVIWESRDRFLRHGPYAKCKQGQGPHLVLPTESDTISISSRKK